MTEPISSHGPKGTGLTPGGDDLLTKVFRSSPESITVSRVSDGVFLEVNEGFERISGYRRDEVIGRSALDLSIWKQAPEDRTAVIDALRRDGSVRDYRITLQTKFGKVRNCLASAELIEHGGDDCLVAVVRDVTEQERTERALRESEQRFRSVFESVTDGLIVRRMDGEFVAVNPAMSRMFGFTPEEYMKVNPLELVHPDSLPLFEEVQNAINAGQRISVEGKALHRDGRTISLEIHGSSLLVDDVPHSLLVIRDITERKQAEEALRISEEMYRSLVTNIPSVVWTTDSEGNPSFIGPNIEAIYGFTPDEIYRGGAALWFGRVHPDDLDSVKRSFNALLDGSAAFDVAYRIRKKNGDWIWIHDRATRTYDDDGVVRVDGVFSDVTERRRAEEARRQSEEQYRRIFEAATNGFTIRTLDGLAVEVNPGMCRIYGYTRDEYLKLKPAQLMPPEMLPGFKEFKEKVRAGKVFTREMKGLHKSGRLMDLEIQGTMFQYGGKPHILTTAQDITERKYAEQALRDSEERFRTVFESSLDGIALRRIDGRVVAVNPAMCRIYGYTREEYINLSLVDVVAPESRHIVKAFRKAIEAEQEFHAEAKGIRKDGQLIDVEIRSSPLRIEGALHALTVIRDITERKRMQVELEQSEQLLRAIVADQTEFIVRSLPDGVRTFVNDAYCKHFGLSREECIGSSVYTLIPEEGRDQVRERLASLTPDQPVSTAVHRIIRADGSEGWNEWTDRAIFDESDQVAEYQSVGRDVTERVQAEKALAQNEELLGQIVDATPNSIFVKDRSGRYIMVNRAMAERHGTTPEALVGKTDIEVAHIWLDTPEKVQRFRASEHRVIDRNEPLFIPEEQFTFADGTTHWFQTTKIPIAIKDNPDCLVVVAVDISARKQAERELKQLNEALQKERQALEEKNVALNQILVHLEREKSSYKHEICESVEKLLMPVVDKLRRSGGVLGQRDVDILETTLMGIIEKDIDQFKSNMGRLSARELDICELIKEGDSSKEIAEKLHISSQTVHKHRQQIRRKLQLSNKAVNLAAYLRSR